MVGKLVDVAHSKSHKVLILFGLCNVAFLQFFE
jgi:hypothetical protein